MKPTAQVVQQRIAQAGDDVKQEIKEEVKSVFETAQRQVVGAEQAPGIGQSSPQIPNPNQADDLATYRADMERKTAQRMIELKAIIDQAGQEQRIKAQEAEQARITNLNQELQANKPKEEEKIGLIASISKKLKGRLGHVGKGKMERGRAAGG